MVTRAVHVVIDAADRSRLAAFWAAALDWEVRTDDPDEAVVWPAGFTYPGTSALPLVFVSVPDVKTVKNRIHLDLASTSAEHQAALVDRVLGLGATRMDIGQGDVAWEVLADPEGNEFCVLEPRPGYADTGPVAAVVTDCADPAALAGFWAAASGWSIRESGSGFASLRHAGDDGASAGPFLEMLRVPDAKVGKNRVHVDVAPLRDGDTQAEARRLTGAGAFPVDVGQGEVSWVVLADPEGNEFCVLSPR
ncbi:MAG TPA: VOC family protein [Streptosporangiaceae bacterium]